MTFLVKNYLNHIISLDYQTLTRNHRRFETCWFKFTAIKLKLFPVKTFENKLFSFSVTIV